MPLRESLVVETIRAFGQGAKLGKQSLSSVLVQKGFGTEEVNLSIELALLGNYIVENDLGEVAVA
jgi:L-lactate utilization protein LutB